MNGPAVKACIPLDVWETIVNKCDITTQCSVVQVNRQINVRLGQMVKRRRKCLQALVMALCEGVVSATYECMRHSKAYAAHQSLRIGACEMDYIMGYMTKYICKTSLQKKWVRRNRLFLYCLTHTLMKDHGKLLHLMYDISAPNVNACSCIRNAIFKYVFQDKQLVASLGHDECKSVTNRRASRWVWAKLIEFAVHSL